MATQRTSGVGAARERETERESAGTYMPEHGASRAQEHVQILCGDTCTFYQILSDNARDAGSCIVTPALSLFLTFPLSLQRTIKWRCAVACGTRGVVQLQNLVTVCLARVVAKEKHIHTLQQAERSQLQ